MLSDEAPMDLNGQVDEKHSVNLNDHTMREADGPAVVPAEPTLDGFKSDRPSRSCRPANEWQAEQVPASTADTSTVKEETQMEGKWICVYASLHLNRYMILVS
jgi:hypothetical protein